MDEPSSTAHHAGIVSGQSHNGLVEVTFDPENDILFDWNDTYGFSRSFSLSSSNECSSGVTAIGDHSFQRFHAVSPLAINRHARQVIIFRLVVDHEPMRDSWP